MAIPAKKLTPADESRGIQNAVSRFKRQREGETLQSELLGETRPGRSADDADTGYGAPANDAEYAPRRSGGSRAQKPLQEMVRLKQEFEALSRAGAFEYDAGDEDLLIKNAPEKPPFPGIIFSIALLKDILDAVQVTGIGIIVTTALSFLIGLVLFLWILSRLGSGWWGKKMRGVWTRYALAVAVEFVPILGILPAATILVLVVHSKELRVVKGLRGALERVRGRSTGV